MKILFKFCAAALMLSACGMVGAADARGDFVSAKKTHFSRKGQACYIVGANFWYGGYLGAASGVGERARLLKELDNMRALGINNLRVLAVSEKTDIKSAVSPASTAAPGQYDEELLVGLDFLMAEVAKRDMTVVLYLNNFWQWSGGMTQYLNWFEGTPALDPNVTKDFDGFLTSTAAFYRSAASQAEYRNVIARIVKRVNTVTGKPYSEDASIMAWQLANEPRPGTSQVTPKERALYVKWIDETAGYIHSLDKNHMVSSGSEGVVGSAQDAQLYLDAHRTSNIDYLTYHLWPKNWGWFDSKNPTGSWDGAIAKSRDYLNTHIELAKKLNKPIVLEEFGLDRDGPSFSIKATTKIRDRYYREVFDVIYQRASKGDPIAGFNFWAWGGAGRAANAEYWWKPGNDFVGDPPQEEQGLYSVFDSDVGSLLLIKEYADRLHSICRIPTTSAQAFCKVM
ncbi:glycoside hydrolase 5 family protein [Duganella violaceipulchra]|uniref:mannan endo-1,4-beta-mannosidase n=2 Tax=Duganella violaceipulchra TaxID=2849652 RepID=A0ABT1GIY0_9BURK|nr:cellulase family glycosylhydrolase [Duganella violaceicalia]MCP2008932.1 mannan endo-1,4-beta-mannosidase [Duganella violaceicalia]